jgi:hypothetical protein
MNTKNRDKDSDRLSFYIKIATNTLPITPQLLAGVSCKKKYSIYKK